MKETQDVQKYVKCECCNKAFGEINELKKHIGTVHKQPKTEINSGEEKKWGNVIFL